jgi:hypothetical protein
VLIIQTIHVLAKHEPVNKQDAKSTLTKKEMTMMEKAKDIIGVGREATEKEKMGRALEKRRRG